MSTEKPETTPATAEADAPRDVTSALDFKKQRDERDSGVLLKLPSDRTVRIKRPSINMLIATGHVPSDVASVVMNGNAAKTQIGTKEFTKMVELQKIIALHSLVVPKLVEGEANYENGEISTDDLTDEDYQAILLYVQQGVTDLAKFRSVRSGGPAGPGS